MTGEENSVAAPMALNIPTYVCDMSIKLEMCSWCCPEIRPNSCWFFVFISTYLYIIYNHLLRLLEEKKCQVIIERSLQFPTALPMGRNDRLLRRLTFIYILYQYIPFRSPYIILFIRQQTFVLPVCPIIRFISSALNLVISYILLGRSF